MSALVEALILEALDVLHHDRADGSDVDQYERRQLRTRFEAVLHAYSAAPAQSICGLRMTRAEGEVVKTPAIDKTRDAPSEPH